MNLKVRHAIGGGMAIDARVPNQLVFNGDGSVSFAARNPDNAPRELAAATIADVYEFGGKPRFSVEPWTGKAEAIPEGYVQSSGQQLSDHAFPRMREDVVASQFWCTEAEWQADPYKRVTHWSLGDGTETSGSWMRPPDKNGVQPGNVGAFYGAGSNPVEGKTGTAVIDAMRNLIGEFWTVYGGDSPGALFEKKRDGVGIPLSGTTNSHGSIGFDASRALPAGTTTDPITGEFRPRTWYGIWIIRMYGRVTSNGEVTVQGLLNQLDLAKARIAQLESDSDFTIIYPNGGSAAAPSQVSINSRYVLANPFPGFSVICQAEVLIGERWYVSGWYTDVSAGSGRSYGVRASYDGTELVVQTGRIATATSGSFSGGTYTGNDVTSPTPCRVKVWKLKG